MKKEVNAASCVRALKSDCDIIKHTIVESVKIAARLLKKGDWAARSGIVS
ncbi:MAG: hypothetical protein K2N48_00270 [Muribaculaceae bacterium]|nr:hypothetical protein [Muribaculaceae bacterium]